MLSLDKTMEYYHTMDLICRPVKYLGYVKSREMALAGNRADSRGSQLILLSFMQIFAQSQILKALSYGLLISGPHCRERAAIPRTIGLGMKMIRQKRYLGGDLNLEGTLMFYL